MDSSQPKTRLLHILQSNTRLRHLSPRTIAAYVSWVLRHVGYHGLRHSRDIGVAGVCRRFSPGRLRPDALRRPRARERLQHCCSAFGMSWTNRRRRPRPMCSTAAGWRCGVGESTWASDPKSISGLGCKRYSLPELGRRDDGSNTSFAATTGSRGRLRSFRGILDVLTKPALIDRSEVSVTRTRSARSGIRRTPPTTSTGVRHAASCSPI